MLLRTMLYSFFIGLCITVTSFASDQAKEKRWAAQIEDSLMDGKSLMLKAGDNEFYALYGKAEKPKGTAIILLHGLGVHPDWPQVINPLRIALPEKGWTVLSLQLPVLENGASGRDYLPLYKDVPVRINAGIAYLKKQGAKKVVLVAHSLGTEMAGYTLTQPPVDNALAGFVGVGMGADNNTFLAKIALPVLDLYGEEDLKNIVASAKERVQAASENKNYKQQRVAKADHFFDGEEAELISSVTIWLDGQGL